MNLNQLYAQKISEQLNLKINSWFNALSNEKPAFGHLLAFIVIFTKCALHTLAILVSTLEYAMRGFLELLTGKCASREYFATLGSFLVINTINALTVIPDIFIRTYYVLNDSKIDQSQTKHTLYYKIMRVI